MTTYSMEEMCRAGCNTARGIRHWEEIGLLGEVERSGGGTRRFSTDQLNRARIIAAAQFGGWKLDDIRKMVEGYDSEVHEALLIRLSDQARAAVRLVESLPKPPGKSPMVEYDL